MGIRKLWREGHCRKEEMRGDGRRNGERSWGVGGGIAVGRGGWWREIEEDGGAMEEERGVAVLAMAAAAQGRLQRLKGTTAEPGQRRFRDPMAKDF